MQHKKLYENYHLIAVNRIGYGIDFSNGGEPNLNHQAESIFPLIKNSSSGRKPVLVGHSLGGPIVIKAAINYSEKLQGVFSLAGSLDGSLEPKEWYRGLYKVFPINLLMIPTFKTSNDEIFTHALELYKMEKDWDKIHCPVYIMQGMKDILVHKNNADFAEKKLSHLTKKKIIRIPNEDHFVVWTIDSLIADYIIQLSHE
jgi:pimeloyl-ACP methyl ester carboxylesterase